MNVDDAFVAALLDSLLPGDARWPAAGATRATQEFAARAAADATLADALLRLREATPDDFARCERTARDGALEAFERAEPASFARILTEAIAAYYMDAAVMRSLQRNVGYSGLPPQPDGRDIPPFDFTLLPKRRIVPKKI